MGLFPSCASNKARKSCECLQDSQTELGSQMRWMEELEVSAVCPLTSQKLFVWHAHTQTKVLFLMQLESSISLALLISCDPN